MTEEWRDVVGLEGRYLISSLGRVKGGPALRPRRRGIHGQHPGPGGYLRVRLRHESGKAKNHTVHSLVAEAFIGPRPAGADVNHKDGVKQNNTPGNLEYCTRKENILHASRMGLLPRGEERYRAKYTREQVREVRKCAREGLGPVAIESRLSIHRAAVRSILSGRSWGWLPEVA